MKLTHTGTVLGRSRHAVAMDLRGLHIYSKHILYIYIYIHIDGDMNIDVDEDVDGV